MKKLALLLALLAATAAKADLYVTPTGAGNKDGSSWANAFAGIQAAVDAVDAAYAADGTLHDTSSYRIDIGVQPSFAGCAPRAILI